MTTYIHICLALKYEFLENVLKWYNYDPKSQLETNLAKILWNFPEKMAVALIITNLISLHWIKTPEPFQSLILQSLVMQKFLDAKISRKRNNKVKNYANLAIELKELWNVCSAKTVSIIIRPCDLIHTKIWKVDLRETGYKDQCWTRSNILVY